MNSPSHKLGSVISLLSILLNLLPPFALPARAANFEWEPAETIHRPVQPEIIFDSRPLHPATNTADAILPGWFDPAAKPAVDLAAAAGLSLSKPAALANLPEPASAVARPAREEILPGWFDEKTINPEDRTDLSGHILPDWFDTASSAANTGSQPSPEPDKAEPAILPGWFAPKAPAAPEKIAAAAEVLPAWFTGDSAPRLNPPASPERRPLQVAIPLSLLAVDVSGPPAASIGAPSGLGDIYTATIHNYSSQTAYSISLTATHQSFLIYDDWSQLWAPSPVPTLTVNATPTTIQWTPLPTVTIGPGETITLAFRMRAACNAESGRQLRVGVRYNADPDGPVQQELNTGGLNVTTGRGNLVINKEPALQNLGTPDFGQPITWIVTVQNTGLGRLFDVVITDTGGIDLGQPGGDLTPTATITTLAVNAVQTYTVVGTVEACNFTNVAAASWTCGNLENDGTRDNPVSSTASVLFNPQVPDIDITAAPPLTFPYCLPVTRAVSVSITNNGGPAGNFRLDSNPASGFLQIEPGSVSSGWTYTGGVFSYTDGILPSTGPGAPVTLTFEVRPQNDVCGSGNGEITLKPLYEDICEQNPFTGTIAGLSYEYAQNTSPDLQITKNGPALVNSGDVFTYAVIVSGNNPNPNVAGLTETISGSINIEDSLPNQFEIINGPSVTAIGGTPGSLLTGTHGLTHTFDPDTGPFSVTLVYTVQAITATGGACGASELVNNLASAAAEPTCPGCSILTDTAEVNTAIQNEEGISGSRSGGGTVETCDNNGFLIANTYQVTGSLTITWTDAVFTDALGGSGGGALPPGATPLVYSDTLSVTVNGVDYTAYVTPTTGLSGELVIDLSQLQAQGAVTRDLTLQITYTLYVTDAALNGEPSQTFYDWTQLYLPGVSDNQACAGDQTFNQALNLTIRRADLQVDVAPRELNRCETNVGRIRVTGGSPDTESTHVVVTFTASTAEIESIIAHNVFTYTGGLNAISPTTVLSTPNRGDGTGVITFAFQSTADLDSDGEIQFLVDIPCTGGSTWRGGVTFDSRCNIGYGDTDEQPHVYLAPNITLFATPIRYTVRDKEVFWKFFVTNNGSLTATNVVITNAVNGLSVLTYTTDSGSGNFIAPTLPISGPPDTPVFTLTQLAPNEQREVTVTARIFLCNPLAVTITAHLACFGSTCARPQRIIDFNTPSPYLLTNNGETADLPMCDLGQVIFTTKNASPDVNLYQLTITETLINLIPNTSSEAITVSIINSDGAVVQSTTNFDPVISTTYGAGDSSTTTLIFKPISAPTEVLTWFNELPPLYLVRITVPVNTGCDPPNSPQSFAQASAFGPCNNHLGYTEDALTLHTLKPDLTVEKDGKGPAGSFGNVVYATPGETVTWRIRVNNRQTQNSYVAHNAVLSDTWPPNFEFDSASARVVAGTHTPPITMTVMTPSRTINWDIGDIEINDTFEFLITGTVVTTASACSNVTTNTTRLTFGCDTGCTSQAVPQDTAQLDPTPRLQVTILPNPLHTCEGDIPIRIRNLGAAAFSNALTITLPGGYVYSGTYTSELTPTAVDSSDLHAPIFYWDEIPGRPANANYYQFVLTLTVKNNATSGTCPLEDGNPITAALRYDNHAICTNPGPWETTHTTSLDVRTPTLSLAKTPRTQTVDVGQRITWTIHLTNTGDGLAENIIITDVVGSNYTNTIPGSGSDGASPTINGSVITWVLPATLPVNGVWTATVSAELLDSGDNRNVVTATAACATGCETTSANNIAYTTLQRDFRKNPDVQTGTIGSLAVFTFATFLSDIDTLYEQLTITDTLPAGLGYVASVLAYTPDQDAGGPQVISNTPTSAPGLYNSGSVVWNLGHLSGTVQIDGVITAVLRNIASNQNGISLTNWLTMTYTDDGQPYVYTDTAEVDILEPLLHIGKSYVTEEGCGATLLQDNFNDGSLSNWTIGGNVEVRSGNLHLYNSGDVENLTELSDFSLSFMARKNDLATTGTDPRLIIYFRNSAAGRYNLEWQPDGDVRLYRTNGSGTFEGTQAAGLQPHAWYHFEIRAEGSRIRVYVDGQQIFDEVNSSFAGGNIQIRTSTGSDFSLDDILITRLNQTGCTVGANDLVTYTLTVSSQQNLPGYDLVITDALPAGMSLVTYSLQSSDPASAFTGTTPASGATGVITWGVNQLAATNSPIDHNALTITVVLSVANNITANTILPNQAFLEYDNWQGSSSPTTITRRYSGGSHSTAVRTVDGGIEKQIHPIEPPPTATLGTLVTYTLIVPAGPISATLYNVVVTDQLSLPQFYIENVTIAGGVNDSSNFDQSSGLITATFDAIPHSTQAYITITTRISHEFPPSGDDPDRFDVITNSAVMTHATATELTRTNEVSTTVHEPQLSITKTGVSVTGDPQAVSYTVRVSNNGDAVAYGPLVIQDRIPPGVTVTNISNSGQLLPDNRTISWTLDSLAIGAFVEFTYRLILTQPIYTTSLFTNTAVVTGSSLTNTIPGVRPYTSTTDYPFPWPLGRIGNYVWVDSNYDGIQNDGLTAPISDVIVDLYNSTTGEYITSTTTNADGEYYFENLPLGVTYTVQLSTVNFTGVLSPYFPTRLNAGSPLSDSNGSPNATFYGEGYAITTTVLANSAVTTEDLSLDYGFVPRMALGNQVWFDSDDDGEYDAGTEPPISDVVVYLYRDTNGDGQIEPGERISTTTTNAGGYYTFTNLLPSFYPTETYYVVITTSNFTTTTGGPLEGYRPSSVFTTSSKLPGSNNFNHGSVTGTLGTDGFVSSTVITLTPYIEPDIYLGDDNANYTIDFGFLRTDLGDLPVDGTTPAGYAPQTYPTQIISDGARHTILPNNNPTLGSWVDAELDGQPSITATGDDLNEGSSYLGNRNAERDDEDGVTFTSAYSVSGQSYLIPGELLTITVRTLTSTQGGADGRLTAWIDFDGDGVLENNDERITLGRFITAGETINLAVTVPLTAAPGITTYARFRFSSITVTQPTGHAASGEVEDYALPTVPMDWGDLPDDAGPYNTTYASDGPRHIIDGTYLGRRVDAETDGTTNNRTADGDDTLTSVIGAGDDAATVPDDEDGIQFLTPIMPGRQAQIQVTAGTTGHLNSWFDFDGDGNLDVFTITNISGVGNVISPSNTDILLAGNNIDYTLTFTVPNVTISTSLYSRFRFTTNPGEANTPDGLAPSGEVEDYVLLSLGDLVWLDDGAGTGTTNDGIYDTGQEQPIPNVVLVLLDESGNPVRDNTGNPITTTTDSDGRYLFTGLMSGTYRVQVTATNFITGGPLEGLFSTDDTAGGANDPDNDQNEDQDENGEDNDQPHINGITSLPITLSPGNEPITDTPTSTAPWGGGDSNSNLTVDFGFVPKMSLGNQVWFDINNDGTLDAGEPPITNVTVVLYRDTDGNGQYTPGADEYITQTQTVTGGYYTFTNLLPDGYLVVITQSNFTPGGALEGYITSTTAVSGNSDLNDTNHGYLTGTPGIDGYVASTVVTLTLNNEPTDDGDSDNNSNLTLDFGFLRYDLGDLPDGYGTVITSNGPRHVILPNNNPTLGTIVDAELDGQPSTGANGDDDNDSTNPFPGGAPNDDEDGVTFSSNYLVPGERLTITVTAANVVDGYLNAWIDLNNDGVLDESDRIAGGPGGFIAANDSINIVVTIPLTVQQGITIYSRFRFTTLYTQANTPNGLAPNGEVEDYGLPVLNLDWGDLPEGPYNTTDANNGPRHIITDNLQIGPGIDAEQDGNPDSNAEGDDTVGSDDEDGVTFSDLIPGETAIFTVSVTNTTGLTAYVYGFIDWNADGDFDDANEVLTQPVGAVTGGDVPLTFSIPATAEMDTDLGLRFRLSTDSGLGPDGLAPDGEVEDYITQIPRYDWGDLPDDIGGLPDYNTDRTGLVGPSHRITPGLQMGNEIDDETDGIPDANAEGDDLDQSPDDEDGVTFPPELVRGNPAIFTVSVTNTTGLTAYVYGFIDWNADGDFNDLGEAISRPTTGGDMPLTFTIPTTAATNTDFGLRFRLSTEPGLGPDGPARDGEIEDYLSQIPTYDWGDLPESLGYNTISDTTPGPSHLITDSLQIGPDIDAERDGFPDANAEGDDNHNRDDEDGITFPPPILPGSTATFTASITNTTGLTAYVYGFIDWNADGDFNDLGEAISRPTAGGDVPLTFNVPITAAIDDDFGLRFRLSTDSGLGPDGPAPDGEIEDYMYRIPPPALGFSKQGEPGGVVEPGDTLTYTLCYSNYNGSPATNVVITDTIPFNTSYVPGSVTTQTGSVEFNDGTNWLTTEPLTVTGLRWLVGDLPNSPNQCVNFNVTVNMTLSDTMSGLSVRQASEGWMVVAGDTTGLEIIGYTGTVTATPTVTPTLVPTITPTITPTLSPTPDLTPTATATPVITPTGTPIPTLQPTLTPTVEITATTPAPTLSATPIPTPAVATATPVPTPTTTPLPTATEQPAITPTLTATPTPPPTEEPEPTEVIETDTPTPEPTATLEATTETTASAVGALYAVMRVSMNDTAPVAQPAVWPQQQITPTSTSTPTSTPEPAATPTPAPTAVISPTPTAIPVIDTPTPEATLTSTAIPTGTVSTEPTATATNTPTLEPSPTLSSTPTVEITPVVSETPVVTLTTEPAMTPTIAISATPEITATPMVTVTPTATATPPPTDTVESARYAIVPLDTVQIDIVNNAVIGSDQTPTQTTTVTQPVVRVVDPAVTKRVDPTRAEPGDEVTFYVTIDNPSPPNSNANATNVVVQDPLPLMVDLIDYDISSVPAGVISTVVVTNDTVDTGHPTITQTTASTITVNIPVLAPGEQIFLTIRTRVNNLASPPPQTINNAVTLAFNEGVPRSDSSPPIIVPVPPTPNDGDDDDDDEPPAIIPTPTAMPTVLPSPTVPVLFLPETGLKTEASTFTGLLGSLLLVAYVGSVLLVVWRRKKN